MPEPSMSEYIQALLRSREPGNQVAATHYLDGHADRSLPPGDAIGGKDIAAVLSAMGFNKLYCHQVEALNAIASGEHVVVATPTCSGKSLIYHASAICAVGRSAASRALFLFPLKALAQDQLKVFNDLANKADSIKATAAIYDGDTGAYQRKKLRQHPPHVLMTNPDMLHLALLPHHERWQSFFQDLKLVVIDEAHAYHGMLGSHMAQIMRRLHRICRFYGAKPVFVLTSATMTDPVHQGENLISLPVRLIESNGAPQGGRHIALMDPLVHSASLAISLLKAAMARGLRTIVYTQSRRLAELMTLWARQGTSAFSKRISVYRAGLMAEERRKIEERLKNGELLAVITTSALESGIDIGFLDLCLLVGYPGSMISTWQRSGRVGRKGQDAGLILIAGEDALDKYWINHPESFWNGRAESVVLNPFNKVALASHLACAAAELTLDVDEPWLAHPQVAPVVDELERRGVLKRTLTGHHLFCRQRNPHRDVSIRGTGRSYRIIDISHGQVIGQIDAFRVWRETHPGAVYLHQSQTYRIEHVDDVSRTVSVLQRCLDYHTRVRSASDITILETEKQKYILGTHVCLGRISISDQVLGYDQINNRSGQVLKRVPLQVPADKFETQGLWYPISAQACCKVQSKGFDLLGSLHAAEHAAISLMPLLVLADRSDIGGLSTMYHPELKSAAIFIYDGIPGGAGFSEEAYERADHLIEHGLAAIENCPCESGCPACVHSPKCGSGNSPIDKGGAAVLLAALTKCTPSAGMIVNPVNQAPRPMTSVRDISAAFRADYCVFDLETQLSAEQVGGWHRARDMKMSCGVVFDSATKQFISYLEHQVDHLIRRLKTVAVVVGFNLRDFDFKVLSAYTDFDFTSLRVIDLLDEVHRVLGYRISLDHLARETIGVSKTGTGLEALQWWQNGEIEKIISYCRNDVCITRDLYEFVRCNGYLVHRECDDRRFRIPIHLSDELLSRANH